jgi:hypothetical protein
MKRIYQLTFLLLFITGCAKIPVESVVLADALQEEGERMHKINLLFLNRIFSAKRDEIEKFMKDEYTPKVVDEFVVKVKKEFPATDFKAEFSDLMTALMPKINKRRDSLVTALELQKEKIVDKLNTDYKVFDNSAMQLKNLLRSAVKVDAEKQGLFNQAKALSNNRLDFNSVEAALDRFIHSAGNVGNNVTQLDSVINQLLNKK